jgi:hypothetical protein
MRGSLAIGTKTTEFADGMPRHLEFEVKYLNNAEQFLAGIALSRNDEPRVEIGCT